MVWAVTIGAEICPFYYAARTALRMAERTAVAGASAGQQWTRSNDPLAWVLTAWAWERGRGVEIVTRDGTLLLGEDGSTIVNAVAKRAWGDGSGRRKQEPSVRRYR